LPQNEQYRVFSVEEPCLSAMELRLETDNVK